MTSDTLSLTSITLIILGGFLFVGLWTYTYIYIKHITHLRYERLHARAVSLFSHVNADDATATPHIIAGLSTMVGLIGLITLAIVAIQPFAEVDASLMLSLFSALTVLFFAATEIWTLWQTRRISHERGHKIDTFPQLIARLAKDLEKLEKAIRKDFKNKPHDHHRLYIVAPHFLFGMLSHPDADETIKYKEALTRLFERRRVCETPFPIEVICGTDFEIIAWHKGHIKDADSDELQTKNDEFEQYLKYLDERGTREGETGSFFTRISPVPDVQFMIIGNTLFEFTMNSKNKNTEILNTQVMYSRRTCESYINQFKFIKNIAPKNLAKNAVHNDPVTIPLVAQ